MIVYDFDMTIYQGDSTLDFYFYCLRHHPKIVLCLPMQLLGLLKYKFRLIEKDEFKEQFYSFLEVLEDVDSDVRNFWKENFFKIKKWYLHQKRKDDVIISASPFFVLDEVCRILGVSNLIASQVDKNSGKLLSTNCYGEQKVLFFKEKYDVSMIECFYSDSLSDVPMAKISKKAYLVKKDTIIKWPF